MHRVIANWKTYAKAILVALCIAIGLSNSYVPLPIVVEKDLSIAFPCQAKGCGCSDANQCWANCCCHSDAEKLAWAEQNDVAPPAWFLEKIRFSSNSDSQRQPKCCCSQGNSQPQQPRQNASCETDKPAISPASCCQSKEVSCCSTSDRCCSKADSCCESSATPCCTSKSTPAPVQSIRMTLKEQRGCQGLGDELAELNLELIPLTFSALDFAPLQTETLCYLEPSLVSTGLGPPEPIPE